MTGNITMNQNLINFKVSIDAEIEDSFSEINRIYRLLLLSDIMSSNYFHEKLTKRGGWLEPESYEAFDTNGNDVERIYLRHLDPKLINTNRNYRLNANFNNKINRIEGRFRFKTEKNQINDIIDLSTISNFNSKIAKVAEFFKKNKLYKITDFGKSEFCMNAKRLILKAKFAELPNHSIDKILILVSDSLRRVFRAPK